MFTSVERLQFGAPGQQQQLAYPQLVTFGAASSATFFDGGIFGLSFPSSGHPTPPFSQGVQQGIFDQPIFTAYFGDCDSAGTCPNNGVITFGGFDDEHCSRQYSWIPLAGSSLYWQFVFTSVQIGQYAYNQPSYASRPKASSGAIVDETISSQRHRHQLHRRPASGHSANRRRRRRSSLRIDLLRFVQCAVHNLGHRQRAPLRHAIAKVAHKLGRLAVSCESDERRLTLEARRLQLPIAAFVRQFWFLGRKKAALVFERSPCSPILSRSHFRKNVAASEHGECSKKARARCNRRSPLLDLR